MQQGLTSEDVEHLLSLSDTELEEFFSSISPDRVAEIARILSEPQTATVRVGDYANSQSAKVAAIQNAKTAAAQEVGPLPDPQSIQRRERASADNLRFAETYFPKTFYMGWAPYQRTMMDRFQSVILEGGKECHAVRRGGLKSTCARVSAVWAAVNGHRRFPVLVGATDDKASEHRENFFRLLASSELLLLDYPELMPLILKWKQPKKSFRLNGRLLTIHAKDERGRIVFPDIHESPSCECHVAPYSLMATDVSGLSYVDRFGVSVRPDVLIFDDVQTPQSANSPSETDKRENAITKTFCGLAGLGEKIAAISVCTVREHDDLTQRFLNRKRHADWNGKRYPSLLRLPERMDLWDQYAKLLFQGATPAEGKQIATEFYAAHREQMDAGGKVAWESDKQEDELSSLQSMMTIRAIDPEFFAKEIQQEAAQPANTTGVSLDANLIIKRLSHCERGTVPEQASYLTAFVDSQDEVLFWMVVAWSKDFSGWIVDYGTWPDQERAVFYKSALNHKLSDRMKGASWEEAFVHAHHCVDALLLKDWPTQNGTTTRQIDLMLKDWSDGQHKPHIESQILASADRNRIRPSKGFAPSPGKKPLHLWGDMHRDKQNGMEWVEKRSEHPAHVQYNTNIWKSNAARRLLTVVGAPSAVVLPGSDENEHKLLGEHFTSETPVNVVRDNVAGVRWELKPGRNNDYWDCYVGNCVAASILGCGIGGERPQKQIRTFQIPGGRRG